MTLEIERLLDETGWQLLQELQCNARLSYSDLGQRVGLSSPAVAERIHKMEEAGIITAYRAEVNPALLGLPISAILRMSVYAGESLARFTALAKDIPEIMECYRVTGGDSYILKIIVSTVAHLEALIDRLAEHGQVTTSIVLSAPVSRRIVTRELYIREQEPQ
jgi:Lrp/AsnC family transcriptional regulator, leucine-responsive regulatory protein